MESAFHEGADSFNYQVSFPTGGKRLSKGLAEITKGQAKCQHANTPPRQVPGRVVFVPGIALRLPSQPCGQCRHHQETAYTIPSLFWDSTASGVAQPEEQAARWRLDGDAFVGSVIRNRPAGRPVRCCQI